MKRTKNVLTHASCLPSLVGAVLVLSLTTLSHTWAGGSARTDAYPGHLALLPGELIVLGTVEVEVRPFVEEKLGNVPKGKSVILLLNDENKVTDVAIPPESQR